MTQTASPPVALRLRPEEEYLRFILDYAPVVIVTATRAGVIQSINRARLASGRPIDRVLGASAYDFIEPQFHARVRGVLESRSAQTAVESFEIATRPIEGKQAWYLVLMGPPSEEGIFTAILTDITQLKQAELDQRQSEATNRALLSAVPGLMFRIGEDGTYLDFRSRDAVPYVPPQDFLGKRVAEVLPSDVAAVCMNGIQRALETQQPQIVEYALQVEDEKRDYEARIAVSGPHEVVAMVREVTNRKRTDAALAESILQKDVAYQQAIIYSKELKREIDQRKHAQKALQELSLRLVEVQEAERRHIARELHDEIGQLLTGLKLALEKDAVHPNQDGLRLVNQLMDVVHDLSLDLRPAILDDAGLLPALLWHLDRFTSQTRVRVNLEHKGIGRRFPTEVETAAYRTVQEALTNVARHAGVDEVLLDVRVMARRLCIRLEDRGVGFDPQAVLAAPRSSGLSGMRERVTLLGGAFSVESSPGMGTKVIADLPITRR